MSYEIRITKAAEKDINNAADYIERVLYNPQAADALLDAIETKVANLAEFPQQFSVVYDPVLRTWGIRFAQVKNYLIFYTVSEQDRRVDILRFLYGKRDWASILGQELSME